MATQPKAPLWAAGRFWAAVLDVPQRVTWPSVALSVEMSPRSTVGVGPAASSPPHTKRFCPRTYATECTRGAGWAAPEALNEVSGALGVQAWSLPVVAFSADFHTVFTGPFPSVPPTRKMPSLATATEAPARGAGSFRSVDSAHVVILPVATSGVPAKTVSVGWPSAPRPPMTYAVPEKKTAAAWARGAGSAAPWLQASMLPSGRMTVAKTLACGVPVGSVPPTSSVSRPAPTIAASVRASGSASWTGLGSQGRIVPAGAGQGTVSFDAGQKLMGVTSRAGLKTLSATPRSIVFCTVA